MLIRRCTFLAPLILAANAFKDTSPLFMISNDQPDNGTLSELSIAQSASVRSLLIKELDKCRSDVYIFVTQPGISADDFRHIGVAPHLQKLLQRDASSFSAKVIVEDVVGDIDSKELVGWVKSRCDAQADGGSPQTIRKDFAALPSASEDRASSMKEHDVLLNTEIDGLGDRSFTLVYTTSPPDDEKQSSWKHPTQLVEMDEPYPGEMHTNMKRDLDGHARAVENSSNLPLFETYQYLTAPLFTGFFAALLLLSILFVGFNALSSLEVSYGAFNKEMGPAAHKKQQ